MQLVLEMLTGHFNVSSLLICSKPLVFTAEPSNYKKKIINGLSRADGLNNCDS